MVAPTKSWNSTSAFMFGRKSCSMAWLSVSLFWVVDLVCFLVRRRCPFAVAVDLGRYLRTCAEVIGGKLMSWSLSIALQNVLTVGEKRH
jgi:hypothetical protein